MHTHTGAARGSHSSVSFQMSSHTAAVAAAAVDNHSDVLSDTTRRVRMKKGEGSHSPAEDLINGGVNT